MFGRSARAKLDNTVDNAAAKTTTCILLIRIKAVPFQMSAIRAIEHDRTNFAKCSHFEQRSILPNLSPERERGSSYS
ncbi:MAG: hypothetical protein Aurels2KO_35670 [Aureliella sp.]